jgi:hypothetical protein
VSQVVSDQHPPAVTVALLMSGPVVVPSCVGQWDGTVRYGFCVDWCYVRFVSCFDICSGACRFSGAGVRRVVR